MILDCCAQQRTYEKFFGLLAQVIQMWTLPGPKKSPCLVIQHVYFDFLLDT